ncbi:hypothetical protein GGR54DRAFT_79628 [Hypoxylon sp. NC1633]|nr:hypothetical protein GGR54DRAFT_79628 [Hypoxylon sp. NC1633]
MAFEAPNCISSVENRVLGDINESQDSQALINYYILSHGVGVQSSSPAPLEPGHQLKRTTTVSSAGSIKTSITRLSQSPEEDPTENASNALLEPDAPPNKSSELSIQPPPGVRSSVPLSSPSILTSELREQAPAPVQPVCDNATHAIERHSQLIRDDALPTPQPSQSKKSIREMSSGSPTQSNDGRSYEQYADNNSEPLPSSSRASSVHEHPTLHEEDTGFLDFERAQFDIPESVPEDPEAEVNFANQLSKRSQPTSQAPGTIGHVAVAPETPAIGQRLLQHGGHGNQLMGASQLFGQTQWTSAVKRASPTSSRPSPDVFNQAAISPNILVSSPLKHRGLATSPTQAFTSSPAVPIVSSGPSDGKTPSALTNSYGNDDLNQGNIAETPFPRFNIPRQRNVLEPIGEYKPLRKQSLESGMAKSPPRSDEEGDSESEAETAAYRRLMARSKKEKAARTFPSVSLPRSSLSKGEKVEVPSTSRTRSMQDRRANLNQDSNRYLAQCYGKPVIDNGGSQETVADSQELPTNSHHAETNMNSLDDTHEETNNGTEDPHLADLPEPRAAVTNIGYKEMIPETSPPATSIDQPKLLGDIMRQQSSIRSGMEAVSFTALSIITEPEQRLGGLSERRSSSLPEPLSSKHANRKHQFIRSRQSLDSSPPVVLASSQQDTTRQSARLRNAVTPSPTGPDTPLPSDPGTKTSTLTSLSATPHLTSSITPNTEPGSVSEDNERRSLSPAAAKAQRQGRPTPFPRPSSSLPKAKATSRPRESIRRLTRHSSMSTDELAPSPLSVSNKEEQRSPARKPTRQSVSNYLFRESAARRGIFGGMVFALSFQSGQARRNRENVADRTAIENMIRQDGGRILSDGFDELFKFDSFQAAGNSTQSHTLSSSLRLLDQDTGFTALIADSHSRKVKYMQALALGIPCLAPQWIMNCISKKEIVDWSSYLLCAGPSTLLGDAIRSRSLQPYDASTTKLAEVIENRPKLLDEAQILLVMKKTKNEGRRLPYVFLAQVLGGSLVRVYSLEEARAKLRESESQDQPFDWVYVDDHLHNAQNALFGTTPIDTGSKKRKRQSVGSDPSDRPPKKIRTLNDELVIQSLILGRLIEEGETDE